MTQLISNVVVDLSIFEKKNKELQQIPLHLQQRNPFAPHPIPLQQRNQKLRDLLPFPFFKIYLMVI